MGKASWFGEPSGSVIKLRYVNQVLRLHNCPIHMFQQNNARAHTARDFLQQHSIRMMPWPALSPDVNPIEHTWDEIQRQLNEVRPRPITAADLNVVLLKIWAAIPMAFINRLIHSMYRRCVSVVNAHGGHTRY